MKIENPQFAQNESIPSLYTCDSKNISPTLLFSDIPSTAKSLVLIMDDPDVPRNLKPDGMFDHWVLYNIDPTITEIPEADTTTGTAGLNGTGKTGYTGPCPPDREHRYFFKLYALDTLLIFQQPPTKDEVEKAMEGHIIEKAELMGKYKHQ